MERQWLRFTTLIRTRAENQSRDQRSDVFNRERLEVESVGTA